MIGASAIWGMFPHHLKKLAPVPAAKIMAHRTTWCCQLESDWLASWRSYGENAQEQKPRREAWASATNTPVEWL